MDFIKDIIARAKAQKRKLVFPEGYDVRVLAAAERVANDGVADVVLLGCPDTIAKLATDEGIDLTQVDIVDPQKDPRFDLLAEKFYEQRKEKGISLEDARHILSGESNLYYAGMLLKEGQVDGCVAGAANTTGDVIRAAIQTVGMSPGINRVSSSIFVVTAFENLGEKGVFLMADVAVNPDPDERDLAEIAVSSAQTYQAIMKKQPKVAMLSFSTKGSAEHPAVAKVREATMQAKILCPDLLIDGELQIDPAVDPKSASRKAPGSPVAGQANVLVFPDLGAANIGSKMPQVIGGAKPIGPLVQGVDKPFNDLSRSCKVDDIVVLAAMTSLQAG